MTPPGPARRIGRRETHSPRSALAITVAVVVALACLYGGTETVLDLLGRPPLLAAPSDMAAAVLAAGSLPAWVLIGSGVVAAVVGILLVVAAVVPGRRNRHLVPSERAVVVVDDRVIASALARHASAAAGADPDDTVVSVGRRTAVVHVTPASGVEVDEGRVRAALDDQLARYRVTPTVRGRIRIATNGRVGA